MSSPSWRSHPAPPGFAEVARRFAVGQSFHLKGLLGPAELAYRAILTLDPEHADAWHMLGVVMLQTGRTDEGLAAIAQAIVNQPGLVEAHLNRGLALLQADRPEEALDSFERVLALRPGNADAQYNRGVVLARLGLAAHALECFERTLAIQPDHRDALLNRAAMLHELHRGELALQALQKLLALHPGDVEGMVNRGIVLNALDRPSEALQDFDNAVARKPGYAAAQFNRGALLIRLERLSEALHSIDRAIALEPANSAAHFNRGVALKGLRRLDEALVSFDRALALQPVYPDALINRGAVLRIMGRAEDALESQDRALAIQPARVEAHVCRGAILHDLMRLDEATVSYDRALALEPENAQAAFNKGVILLSRGEFERGWRLYESRRALTSDLFARDRPFEQPCWTARAPLAGKTLFVYWEQGFGDTLQFCRYASIAADEGARVILSVQDELRRLFERFDPRIEVIGGQQIPAAFDYHTPLMSLAGAFAARTKVSPLGTAYLSADPTLAKWWAERLGSGTAPRVGVVWSGGRRNDHPETWAMDARRSLPLPLMATLGRPDIGFVSLQKGREAEAELARDGAAVWPELRVFGSEIGNFADTAALIANLDLVITVDTAVAHLAGAMGKPVWILNRHDACWRWLLGRADSPWYPTARLFRQPSPGSWDAVLSQVRAALDTWPASSAHKPEKRPA